LVNLVEDWETLEGYAGDKQGYYQVLNGDGVVEVRVAIGRLGFRKEFDKKADPLFSRILAFCNARKYVKINESIRDELFFK
jgi:hypothetical protein